MKTPPLWVGVPLSTGHSFPRLAAPGLARVLDRDGNWGAETNPDTFVMPTEVGIQTTVRNCCVDAWLDPGLRRDDGGGEVIRSAFGAFHATILALPTRGAMAGVWGRWLGPIVRLPLTLTLSPCEGRACGEGKVRACRRVRGHRREKSEYGARRHQVPSIRRKNSALARSVAGVLIDRSGMGGALVLRRLVPYAH